MYYWILSNLVLVLHLGFIFFVVFGAFLVLRWRRIVFLHVPAAVWGVLIEYRDWVCPLTPLEHYLRQAGNRAGYSGGFIEHYLMPVVYPGCLDRKMQIVLGTLVLVINVAVYGWLLLRTKKAPSREPK